jgi:hypothetical protein
MFHPLAGILEVRFQPLVLFHKILEIVVAILRLSACQLQLVLQSGLQLRKGPLELRNPEPVSRLQPVHLESVRRRQIAQLRCVLVLQLLQRLFELLVDAPEAGQLLSQQLFLFVGRVSRVVQSVLQLLVFEFGLGE